MTDKRPDSYTPKDYYFVAAQEEWAGFVIPNAVSDQVFACGSKDLDSSLRSE
jgi:hypothetical protein